MALNSLLILTSGSWHSLSGEEGSGLTPTNQRASLHGYGGASAVVAPTVYGQSVLMVESDERTISEIRYSFDVDGYDKTQLNVLSRHLFDGREVKSWARQEDPYDLLWAQMDDGTLRVFTFLREQEVWAWTPCETDGEVIQVGSLKREGVSDELYLLVKRTVNNETHYYVETLTDRSEGIFLDCALSYEGSPTTTISGLEHLEGRAVSVWADGYWERDYR